MPSSRGSSQPRNQTRISYVSCIGRQVLCHWATWEAPRTSHRSINIAMVQTEGTIWLYSQMLLLWVSETDGGSDSRRKPSSFRVIFLFSKAWHRWSSLTSTLNARKLKDSLGKWPCGGRLDKQPLYARKQVWSSTLCTGNLLTFYDPTGIIWGKLCAEENNSHLFLLGISECTSPAEHFGSFFTAKKKFYTPHCPFKDSGYWNAKAQIQLRAESQHFQAV